MTFTTLLLIVVVGLLGPLLAAPHAWRIPVVVGQILGGLLLGGSGLGWLDASEPTFAFLADLGFALTMFVVGTHVPLTDHRLRPLFALGAARAGAVGIIAVAAAAIIAWVFDVGGIALFAVVIASSSAAVVMPVLDELRPDSTHVLPLITQVAIADTVSILLLPLAIDPSHALRAALGSVIILGAGTALFVVLRGLDRRGWWERLRDESKEHRFALELRISIAVVAGFAALAIWTHVSIMLAGFVCGIAVAAVGSPRRLARQLFGLTDGFLSPLFFVWLGASLSLGDLFGQPRYVLLGLTLGGSAVVAHLALRATGLPWRFSAMSAAQMGVPIAAATIGTQTGEVNSGVATALILSALVTVVVLAAAARSTAAGATTGA